MNWYKQAKQVEHNYSWVYVDLPSDIAKEVVALGKQIDKDDLFDGEGDGGLELEPHVTVKYGLLTDDVKEIKECLDGAKGGTARLETSSVFEGEKYDVVKIHVESEVLEKLHETLNRLCHEDKHPIYHAHATIAYVKPGCGKKYDGKFKIGKSFKIDKVYFGNRDDKNFGIKLANMDWYARYCFG